MKQLSRLCKTKKILQRKMKKNPFEIKSFGFAIFDESEYLLNESSFKIFNRTAMRWKDDISLKKNFNKRIFSSLLKKLAGNQLNQKCII